jgi:hypothetical protein
MSDANATPVRDNKNYFKNPAYAGTPCFRQQVVVALHFNKRCNKDCVSSPQRQHTPPLASQK